MLPPNWRRRSASVTAFAPTVALMRRAKARGLEIVIVSDTYLDRKQLAALISATAGPSVLSLIDTLYCSSEYGIAKGSGLLKRVVTDLQRAPAEILHIGDNSSADFAAAQAAGVHALHLRQFSPLAEQRLRLEAAVSAIIHARATDHDLAYQPHRGPLALGEARLTDPAVALGYTTLGPVLTAFADWLSEQRAILQQATAGSVHTLFLMRDGHLPREVFEADPARCGTSHAVEISRFTATAVSFIDRDAVTRFVEQNVGSGLAYLLKQLLFTTAEIAKILGKLPTDRSRSAAFMQIIGSPQSMNRILARSRALAMRLSLHLRHAVALKPGDTLMLVDLGYNGSVQNLLEPVLTPMLNVSIAGRYLLYRAQQLTGYDKVGFIDERNYDMDSLLALAANVAVVEQLCTIAQGSVIDYTADGLPIRADAVIKGRQNSIRDRVQAGCIAYAKDRGDAVVRQRNPHSGEAARRSAAAVLSRLMFLPQQHELDVIKQFDHDVNLGTEGVVRLFDPDIAARGMKQRGLFYLKNSERMYLPAELHGQGMMVSLAMLTMKRFNLGLNFGDFCDRSVSLPVLVADGRDVIVQEVVATPTHDGYFAANVPVGDGRFTVAVQFGKLYDVVEILSVQFRSVATVLGGPVAPGAGGVAATPTFEGMAQLATGLFHCADPAGFMMAPPPVGNFAGGLVLEVVFRPLVARHPAAVSEIPCSLAIGAAA